MDPVSIGSLAVAVGSVVASALAYRRGRKADDALNISKSIDLVLGGQQRLIDDLRSEADRNRAGWDECMQRCERLQEQADRQTGEIADLHETIEVLRYRLHQAGLT